MFKNSQEKQGLTLEPKLPKVWGKTRSFELMKVGPLWWSVLSGLLKDINKASLEVLDFINVTFYVLRNSLNIPNIFFYHTIYLICLCSILLFINQKILINCFDYFFFLILVLLWQEVSDNCQQVGWLFDFLKLLESLTKNFAFEQLLNLIFTGVLIDSKETL